MKKIPATEMSHKYVGMTAYFNEEQKIFGKIVSLGCFSDAIYLITDNYETPEGWMYRPGEFVFMAEKEDFVLVGAKQ